MTYPDLKLTPTAAAALADLPNARVRKEVEHGLVGSGRRPRLTFCDLVYLRTLRLLELELCVADRRKLSTLIRFALSAERNIEAIALSSVLLLELGATVRALTAKLDAFDQWKRRLCQEDEIVGDAYLLAESHIPIHEIARRADRGESTEAIMNLHRCVKREDIAFSQLFARVYPNAGRPRTRRGLRWA